MTATTVKQARFDPDSSRLSLIVTGESIYVSQPLPPMGELVIGRAPDVDMRVDHPSISRQHAIVRVGATITIADLGSANGTRLRGRALVPNEPVEIRPGEVIDLGSVLLVVQPRPSVAPSRRVWTHDYFEGRLEEECVRAGRTGTHFAVLHVAGNATEADGDAARDAILATLRHEDVLGAYAPGAFEALLFEVEPADAQHLALLEHAQELDLGRQCHLADFVEEHRAALGGLEQTRLRDDRAGERTTLVAEQLALEERLGQRGAVEAQERRSPPR